MFKKIKQTLRHHHAQKAQQNEQEDDVPDNTPDIAPETASEPVETALVSDTANRVEGNNIQDQSYAENAADGTLNMDCVEPIEPRVGDIPTVNQTMPNPSAPYTCVDLTSESFEEATEPISKISNYTLSSTCARISKTAKELRNTQKSKGEFTQLTS